MNRPHTLRSIADSLGKEKRTVQNWLTKATSQHGELGAIEDNTRYLSDEERDLIVAFAGVDRPTRSPSPSHQVEVETGNHSIVLHPPAFPQEYSLESLRKSEAITFEDPLAIASQFLVAADQIQEAMQADLKKREATLRQAREAKQRIDNRVTELKLESRIYALEAERLDNSLTSETSALQKSLTTLQEMGKPTAGNA